MRRARHVLQSPELLPQLVARYGKAGKGAKQVRSLYASRLLLCSLYKRMGREMHSFLGAREKV
jgi:hypothetical protein